MKNLIYILSLLAFKLTAQTITPHVINSAGNSQTVTISGNTYFIASNIGEPIITTVNNATTIITQGFLQPEIASNGGIILGPTLITHESCNNKNDGRIQLNILGKPANTFLVLKWNPNAVCPSYNCKDLDSLVPGLYTVRILALDNNTNAKKDSVKITFVINKNTDACQITTYSAFSPDNNGINDTWIIKGIENFTNNAVTIYNRWGTQLKHIPNYDNKNEVWKGETSSGQEVPNGTYFYVIELNDGSKPIKGWVEVTGE